MSLCAGELTEPPLLMLTLLLLLLLTLLLLLMLLLLLLLLHMPPWCFCDPSSQSSAHWPAGCSTRRACYSLYKCMPRTQRRHLHLLQTQLGRQRRHTHSRLFCRNPNTPRSPVLPAASIAFILPCLSVNTHTYV